MASADGEYMNILKKIYFKAAPEGLRNTISNWKHSSSLFNPHIRGHQTVRLSAEFDKFWGMIERGENFTFMRSGDGERAIMTGRAVTAQENWSSPNYITKLGKDLLTTFEMDAPNLYHAISCPCCDPEAYYWYMSHTKTKNITFANFWVNCNYPKFLEKFPTLKRDAVLIANYRAEGAKIGNLNILKHYHIGDDCINFWETQAPAMIAQIKKDFGSQKNLLYVVSAGPMSGPIIAELFKNNPDNAYIDFGSSIDGYYRNVQTRPYMDKNSIYGSRNCWMYKPGTVSFDVSVILTLYKRPETLKKQIAALQNQSLKPKEIILFQDAANPPLDFTLDEELKQSLSNHIKVSHNVGVWGRFAGALMANSKYVCLFDDDTIPGRRWLENCHWQMQKKKGLYGTIGIHSFDFSQYPAAMKRYGWRPCEGDSFDNAQTKRVDFVGHSWFLEKDWLGAMWIGGGLVQKIKYAGEDMYLSYALKKHLRLNTYVPPHPDGELELFGSLPDSAMEHGNDEQALFLHPEAVQRMNSAANILIDTYGMKQIHPMPLKYRIKKILRTLVKTPEQKEFLKALYAKIRGR